MLTLDRHPKLSTVTSLSEVKEVKGQLHWNGVKPSQAPFHDFVIEIKNDYMVWKKKTPKDFLDGTLFLHVVPCVFGSIA